MTDFAFRPKVRLIQSQHMAYSGEDYHQFRVDHPALGPKGALVDVYHDPKSKVAKVDVTDDVGSTDTIGNLGTSNARHALREIKRHVGMETVFGDRTTGARKNKPLEQQATSMKVR